MFDPLGISVESFELSMEFLWWEHECFIGMSSKITQFPAPNSSLTDLVNFLPYEFALYFNNEIEGTLSNFLKLFFQIIPFCLLFCPTNSNCLSYSKLDFHLFNSEGPLYTA